MTRMSKLVTLIALLGAAAACGKKSSAPGSTPGSSAGAAGVREGRIAEVLRYKFPQMAQFEPRVEAIRPSDVEGLEEATLVLRTPQGDQRQKVYVSRNDRVLILQVDPVDASKPVAAIKAEREQDALRMIEGLPSRGNPDAKITVVEFSDFQCPYCKKAEQEVIEPLLARRGKEFRLIYRHYPLDFHPWAKPASIAAICAATQKPAAFWTLHDSYFSEQGEYNEGNLLERSGKVLAGGGIDLAKWKRCAGEPGSPEHQAAVRELEASIESGNKFGVNATPLFMIIRPGGVSELMSADRVEAALDEQAPQK